MKISSYPNPTKPTISAINPINLINPINAADPRSNRLYVLESFGSKFGEANRLGVGCHRSVWIFPFGSTDR